MNKRVTASPLEFGKETIATLTDEQLQALEGGAAAGAITSCWATTCFETQQQEAPEEAAS